MPARLVQDFAEIEGDLLEVREQPFIFLGRQGREQVVFHRATKFCGYTHGSLTAFPLQKPVEQSIDSLRGDPGSRIYVRLAKESLRDNSDTRGTIPT